MDLSEAQQIRQIIRNALDEDIGDGDVTTANTISQTASLTGMFLAKEAGVIAGLEVVREVFQMLDPQVQIDALVEDGDWVQRGTTIATIQGPGQAILMGERVALNFLQRMSGIATMTRAFVDAVTGTGAVILDTRKTAPGLRVLDKMAVRLGGGQNHRFGLWDMALIKDNHIAAVGSIAEAVSRVRSGNQGPASWTGRPIEVEVTNLDQLQEALELELDRILLDNMDLDRMRTAVSIAGRRVPLEASGNVNLETVANIAATGVDYISAGALTHSVKALDISLDVG